MTRHGPSLRWVLGVVALAGLECVSVLALAAQTHKIVQRGRAFDTAEIEIAIGDTIDFSDEDEFLHQIYINSPSMIFDSAEQVPGQIVSVEFPTAGSFDVHCHIHPKMYLRVAVR